MPTSTLISHSPREAVIQFLSFPVLRNSHIFWRWMLKFKIHVVYANDGLVTLIWSRFIFVTQLLKRVDKSSSIYISRRDVWVHFGKTRWRELIKQRLVSTTSLKRQRYSTLIAKLKIIARNSLEILSGTRILK